MKISLYSQAINYSYDSEQKKLLEDKFYEIRDQKWNQVTECDFVLVHKMGLALSEINDLSILERERYLVLLRDFMDMEKESIDSLKLDSNRR